MRLHQDQNMPVPRRVEENGIYYPWLTPAFPPNVRAWLASKYVDPEFRKQGNMFWNDAGQELVFPIYDDEGKMVFSCNRYFGTDVKRPRYVNRGTNENEILVLGDEEANVIFIVEDYISALRIATTKSNTDPLTPTLTFAAHPIFGSEPRHEHLLELSQKYLGCIFFLDPDMHKEAQELSHKYAQYFDACGWIHAHKDPKDYDPKNLSTILTSHVKQMEYRLFKKDSPVLVETKKVYVPQDEDDDYSRFWGAC